jgi:RNA polymerase sigma-70 factor (ECF subfamily)
VRRADGCAIESTMQLGDVDLARRLRIGDEPAFEEFFTEYFPRLYRFARVRLGGDDDAAEEVTQTTLIKALAKIGTFRGEAALFTWLCVFCRREIGAWLERKGYIAPAPLPDDSAEARTALAAVAALSRDDPEQEYRRVELTRLVHTTLDHLPRPYGDALMWKYLDDTSVEEVAHRLGLGYKAAESLLTRARQAFREAFAVVASGHRQPPSAIARLEEQR